MNFCDKCGSMIVPKAGSKAKTLACSSCGKRTKEKPKNVIIKEDVKLSKEDVITVIDKKIETLPQTDEECPKCKNKKAFYWTVQTRAGDESETRFFECTKIKCKHRWRAYS